MGVLPCHRKARTITAGHGKNCCHRPGLTFPSMRTAWPRQAASAGVTAAPGAGRDGGHRRPQPSRLKLAPRNFPHARIHGV
ncbi:hypothetical protein XarbCFBP8130_16880 [Xanthomonas arboricola]|uniref:Uncharacterized protein n=1 Tax=Xanthomonas arboricola TaxID=56448 RepID=A0A2S7AB38_9XANT|nr:hypothetical protein XarbCFBP7629_17940 [Xanthomonas arboricola]PPT21116.1 hypothetical protein XarCFBP6771_09360 [Xanthomonas arboricola]PPT55904.1 hypothetical protein XarbCFBP8153_19295 [Xanthomonas arboricola]PPT62316.1 hypothetical protein XarbCFBP8130_16880 [Xanthomonas arboricola]PPT68473.1 hypothetical protein XarbCFBP8150_14315 [Xanthomonas arboricola]